MSLFDVKKNKAICALPWVHEFKKIGGNIAPCCHGSTLGPNETMDIVRKQMLNNIQPVACKNCYTKEQESLWSPRIQETTDWINKFGEPNLDPQISYIDVRFDPTCNLKCKTCGPWDSTLWQKEKGIKKFR